MTYDNCSQMADVARMNIGFETLYPQKNKYLEKYCYYSLLLMSKQSVICISVIVKLKENRAKQNTS